MASGPRARIATVRRRSHRLLLGGRRDSGRGSALTAARVSEAIAQRAGRAGRASTGADSRGSFHVPEKGSCPSFWPTAPGRRRSPATLPGFRLARAARRLATATTQLRRPGAASKICGLGDGRTTTTMTAISVAKAKGSARLIMSLIVQRIQSSATKIKRSEQDDWQQRDGGKHRQLAGELS